MNNMEESPASFFGGSWERIEQRFLYGHGPGNSLNDTGGETEHTLVTSEIPKKFNIPYYNDQNEEDSTARFNGASLALKKKTNTWEILVNETGGNPHNNMPPYYVVNIWKRVA